MWVYALCERFTAISPTLLPILLDAAIKGFLLLLLTSAATLAMRRTSAAARHLVWFLGVLSLLILPILSAGLPGWHILPRIVLAAPTASSAVFSSPGTPGEARGSDDRPQAGNRSAGGGHLPSEISDLKSPNDPHPNPLPEYRARGPESEAVTPPPAPTPSPIQLPWQSWLLLIWLTGTTLFLTYIAAGFLSLHWLQKKSSRITDGPWPILLGQVCEQLGFHGRVQLLASSRRTMPMTWGLWQTLLLLPNDSVSWTPEQGHAVLLHELAHAKRWDCLMQLLTQLACALYWFNPLLWLAWQRMKSEREQACDDLVLSAGTKPSAYAAQLLHIATEMPTAGFSAAAIAMARPSKLEGRLLAILDATRNRRSLTRWRVLLAALAASALAIPMACMTASHKGEFTQATIYLSMDLKTGHLTGRVPQAPILHLTDRAQVDKLVAFFPHFDENGNTPSGWMAGADVELIKPDGSHVTITVSANDELQTYNGEKKWGDWPVKGDLKAFLLTLLETQPTTQRVTATTQRLGAAPAFNHGIWNMPVIGYVRNRSANAAYRPGPWFSIANSDLSESVQVNPLIFGLPADAPIEEIVKKTTRGDLYEPELGVIEPIRGTLIAPLDLPVDTRVVEPVSFQNAVGAMSCEEIAQHIRTYSRAHPKVKQWRIKDGEHYAVLRADGGLSVMDVHGSGEQMYMTVIPIGAATDAQTDSGRSDDLVFDLCKPRDTSKTCLTVNLGKFDQQAVWDRVLANVRLDVAARWPDA